MKHALLSTGAAVILAAAAFATAVTDADARSRGGNGGGVSHARSSGGNFAKSAVVRSNGGNFARSNARVVTHNFNVVRHHVRRGPIVAFVPGYTTYGYVDGCVVPQRVLTEFGWRLVYVNVCDNGDYDY